VSLVLDDVGDLLPLFLGGIDTGRVVRAGMEEHNGASWRILPRASRQPVKQYSTDLQVFNEALEV
jgi:hypothetical protein